MIIKRAASINARHNRSLLVITNSLLEEIRPQEGVDQAGEIAVQRRRLERSTRWRRSNQA
ncbi:unnamed protein product [Brassica oleracea var. botrytis]